MRGAPCRAKLPSATETKARYLYDPDTPREYSTVRLSAAVTPANEDRLARRWDAVAQVGWPH